VLEAKVTDLVLTYGKGHSAVQALRGVTLSLYGGELTLLVGPSGSGKTSLLTILGCMVKPDRGQVEIRSRDVTTLSEKQRTHLRCWNIGFVFQSFRLFRTISALENVVLPLKLQGVAKRERETRALRLLEHFGLADKSHLKPGQLSGGEKQRVAMARATIHEPQLILADEPTASLDTVNAFDIAEHLKKIAKEQGRTVLVVSHDERLKSMADRLVRLEDGRIVPSGGSL
jgi:putative ABC transport system ATP-binding protein